MTLERFLQIKEVTRLNDQMSPTVRALNELIEAIEKDRTGPAFASFRLDMKGTTTCKPKKEE